MIPRHCTILAAVAVAVPSLAAAQPKPSGFTMELSLGAGYTGVSPLGRRAVTCAGMSGLNLGLGTFSSSRLAVSLRFTGTTFGRRVGRDDVVFSAVFVGPSAQYWIDDVGFVGAGLGVGMLSADRDDVEPEIGPSLDLRVGTNLVRTRHHALHVAVELTPALLEDRIVTGFGMQLGWQLM